MRAFGARPYRIDGLSIRAPFVWFVWFVDFSFLRQAA